MLHLQMTQTSEVILTLVENPILFVIHLLQALITITLQIYNALKNVYQIFYLSAHFSPRNSKTGCFITLKNEFQTYL